MSSDVYAPNKQDDLSLAELALYKDIMAYRAANGLAAVPLSAALTTTAGRHVVDTRDNIWGEGQDLLPGTNLHSWSDAPYYSDGSTPEAMWEAPERLGTGYGSAGYEITAAGYEDAGAALAGWQDSSYHNAILLNLNEWASIEYLAIGVGLDASSGPGPYGGRVYNVWFGEATDLAGVPRIMGSGASENIQATGFADRVLGGSGNDTIAGADGADTLSGSYGNDNLNGGSGADNLSGGSEMDKLFGKAGADLLTGGTGDDTLSGYGENDTLVGGEGTEELWGGTGADVFRFTTLADSAPGAAADRIEDFGHASDRMDLATIDADTGASGNQAFVIIGRAAFTGAGELRIDAGIVSGDVDGDGVSDFEIAIAGGVSLTSVDFIL